MAVKQSKRSGFTLVEILTYVSIYLLLTLLVAPCVASVTNLRQRAEMDGFCQQLAADVTALQQASLWGSGLQNKLVVNLNNQSYAVYREGQLTKKVQLQTIGQGKLYFYSPSTTSVRFSEEGAPQSYFAVLIKNRQQPRLVKKFEVQPVTGRVVISDSK